MAAEYPAIERDPVYTAAGRTFTGPEETVRPLLDALTPGAEYFWNKTDGDGTLLDWVTGVAE